MNIQPEAGFEVERVSPYPNGDVNVVFRCSDKDPGRIRHLEVFMTAGEYRKFVAGDLEVEVGASLKVPKMTFYRRKDALVRAEQIDLKNPTQRAKLGIFSQKSVTGGSVGTIWANNVIIEVRQDDWIVWTLDGRFAVMHDSDFKADFALTSITAPPEVEFSPEDYKKLLAHSRGASAEIKAIEVNGF